MRENEMESRNGEEEKGAVLISNRINNSNQFSCSIRFDSCALIKSCRNKPIWLSHFHQYSIAQMCVFYQFYTYNTSPSHHTHVFMQCVVGCECDCVWACVWICVCVPLPYIVYAYECLFHQMWMCACLQNLWPNAKLLMKDAANPENIWSITFESVFKPRHIVLVIRKFSHNKSESQKIFHCCDLVAGVNLSAIPMFRIEFVSLQDGLSTIKSSLVRISMVSTTRIPTHWQQTGWLIAYIQISILNSVAACLRLCAYTLVLSISVSTNSNCLRCVISTFPL